MNLKKKIKFKNLVKILTTIFIKKNLSKKNSIIIAKVLTFSEFFGIKTHGISRLNAYLELINTKRINTRPKIKKIKDRYAITCVDADNSFGMIAAEYAMKIAVIKSKKFGIACSSVRNSNHFGIAGYYSMLAAKQNCIGISMTNTSACVSVTRGKERMLGTNPLAIAIPIDGKKFFLADFSTSSVSYGKIESAIKQKKKIPKGWIIDKFGKDTTDPNVVNNGGTILPLGSDEEKGSYKGYSLGSFIDIMCGPLSNSAFLNLVPYFIAIKDHIKSKDRTISSKGSGHFFISININFFRDFNFFKKDMLKFIKIIKSSQRINRFSEILIPGEKELNFFKKYQKEGILLDKNSQKNLKEIFTDLNI
jgi:L-2-hydroxycarboxylate dehydrogenase (NAD+)